jgi:hypothetical protein
MFIDRPRMKLKIKPLPKAVMSAFEYLVAVFIISTRDSAE